MTWGSAFAAASQAHQRRTLSVLSTSQVLAGVGVGSGVAAGGLLVAQISGSDAFAGLAQTAGVLGAAIAASPLAALSNRLGRRAGLVTGFATGGIGAVVVIVAAVINFWPLLLVGTMGVGAATAAGLQSRYAATDLALPSGTALSLSLVVWATTVGAVIGPNLMAPASHVADALSLPSLTGAYLVTATALLATSALIALLLRPDPLVAARESRGVMQAPPRASWSQVRTVLHASPSAVLGLVTIAVGHAVMVMVMVMTPVHMQMFDVALTVIGLVISVHVLGMYAFAPLVGWITDRAGGRPSTVVGVCLLFSATMVAGTAPSDDIPRLGVGLFVLGLGWSFTLIAGSALITESVPEAERPAVQGVGDTFMNASAAVAGIVAGVVVAVGSYGWLNLVAALTLVPLVVMLVGDRVRTQRGRVDLEA